MSLAVCDMFAISFRKIAVGGLLALSTCMVLPTAAAQDELPPRTIEELIVQLESNSFVERERATAALIEIGELAVEQVARIPTTAPFEVRRRGAVVEQKVAERIFEQRSRKFLLDLDPAQSYDLPAWNAFRELVGSTRTSKLLFLEMLKHDRDMATLVEAYDAANRASTGVGERETKQQAVHELAIRKAEQLQFRLFTLPTPEIGESLSILFAGAVLDGMAPVEVSRVISGVSQMSFHGYLRKQGYRECIKKLLSAWLPKTHAAMAPEAMRLSLSLELPVVAPIARQHIKKNFDVNTRALAFQCLAKFGEATDVPLLLSYCDETTIVEQFSESASGITVMQGAPPGIPFIPGQENPLELNNRVVRINDLAAVSAMLLLKEDPLTMFPNYSHEKTQLIYTHDLAVSEDESPDQVAKIGAWAQARAK